MKGGELIKETTHRMTTTIKRTLHQVDRASKIRAATAVSICSKNCAGARTCTSPYIAPRPGADYLGIHECIFISFSNSLRLTVVTSGAAVRPVLFAHWVGSVFGKPAWDAVPAFVQTLLHTLVVKWGWK